MKRLTLLAIAATALAGCSMTLHRNFDNAYSKAPFYAKYLNPPASQLDAAIQRDLDQLRANPHSAHVHNDLGQLLVQKGFPKDAEVEFHRAVADDKRFYPAWYNLGLLQSAHDDFSGARSSFKETVDLKPGHANALFQLGLMEERRHNSDAAVHYYVKALSINHQLLDVRVNPRVLDSKLIPVALIGLYPSEHNRESMAFQGTPPGYAQPTAAPAVSPQAAPQNIVTPSAPITSPAMQSPPPTPKP
ncbi:MAG: protein O-mannosyl-transferase [Acidobacteriota bacterium]|jgi:tetratricopeptide (TPR) repeat protein|nr:protein O-mannosyl-transferase [Acidobacteriota bacterium]